MDNILHVTGNSRSQPRLISGIIVHGITISCPLVTGTAQELTPAIPAAGSARDDCFRPCPGTKYPRYPGGAHRLMRNRIKVYRALHDLTQEALAEHLGVTRQTILAIEKEKYDPSLELALRMSQLFKVPMEKLFLVNDIHDDEPQYEE